jgi:hypothetical protein
MMYDQRLYDRASGRYTIDQFLDEGTRNSGGMMRWCCARVPPHRVRLNATSLIHRDLPGPSPVSGTTGHSSRRQGLSRHNQGHRPAEAKSTPLRGRVRGCHRGRRIFLDTLQEEQNCAQLDAVPFRRRPGAERLVVAPVPPRRPKGLPTARSPASSGTSGWSGGT